MVGAMVNFEEISFFANCTYAGTVKLLKPNFPNNYKIFPVKNTNTFFAIWPSSPLNLLIYILSYNTSVIRTYTKCDKNRYLTGLPNRNNVSSYKYG